MNMSTNTLTAPKAVGACMRHIDRERGSAVSPPATGPVFSGVAVILQYMLSDTGAILPRFINWIHLI